MQVQVDEGAKARRFSALRAFLEHRAVRMTGRLLRLTIVVCAVILAVAIVTSLTVDLGPTARSSAETYGSRFLERQLTIGTLSFRLWTGRFLLEDVRIDGLTPESRPFLEAGRIEVAVPWRTLLDRRVVLRAIEMSDWQVYLEIRDGRHNLPRLTRGGSGPRTSDWTTTLEWVRAHRGAFEFEDHGVPWRVAGPNLEVLVARPGDEYRGRFSFSGGTVAIQGYEPFSIDMTSSFTLDGPRVVLDAIDLVTDGARSRVYGDVNLAHWPEQMFRVESTIDFERQRQIFFAQESFRLSGTGRFSGYFHLFKEPLPDGSTRTGRELFGTFESARTGVNEYVFQDLRGSVRWTPERLAVTEATARAYGGRAQFEYEMAPLGRSDQRALAHFDARYDGIGLRAFTDVLQLDGLRLDGAAGGRVQLTWPLGRYAERWMRGDLRVTPPPDVVLMTPEIPVELIEQGRLPRGPAARLEPLIPMPIGAEVMFDLRPDRVRLGASHVATQRTHVAFEGEMAADGGDVRLPFVVRSADWQESYRVFAAMRTALGSRTAAIDIGGYGEFDGVLSDRFDRPHIEGTFAGERMRAWGVEWGSARGHVEVADNYATLFETTVTAGESTITTEGRFSLGFPRADGEEEINARVRLVRRPVVDLREAFGMQRYPVDGLLSGEFHVFGNYRTPLGYGTLALTDAVVYGESLESASATVGLEGTGVRLTAIDVAKGGGRGLGAAYVTWEGDYSFDFGVDAIPVESVAFAARAPLPLSGLIDFTATGSGNFSLPRYSVRGRIRDLFVADEGIGQVVGDLGVVGDVMTLRADIASPRLAVGLSGRIEMADAYFADLLMSFDDTSLDPYVRAFDPRLSPYTTAVVTGALRVVGELANADALRVEARVDTLDLRLFDYPLRNPSPFTLTFERQSVTIADMQLAGEGTQLGFAGVVGLADERLSMRISGAANLAVLQGFVTDVRSSGQAELFAELSGPLRDPAVTGQLSILNGRIRHWGAPHAVDNISGAIAFDSRGVTLDGLTATFAEGPVQFGGRIDKDGYLPGQLGVTIAGQNMRVRYPQGMESVLDTSLTLQGTLDDMRLGGDVRVRNAIYRRPFPSTIFDFISSDDGQSPSSGDTTIPLTYDAIRILAASSIRIQNTGDVSARVTASADLELHGTYDRPVLSGEIELDRGGEITFLDKRYVVTQGTVYFTNPTRIQPSFDIEAETRVRVPGETYRITASVRGACCARLIPDLTSDPSLPVPDIWALLLSDVAPSGDRELRQYRTDATAQQQLLQELATREATGRISSQVSRTVERVFGIDAFRITPSLGDLSQQSSRLEPGARLLIGKRLASRWYLTYSRSLSSSTRDEIVLLEFDQSERLSWSLSRNEDQTYALEVRVRHAF